MRSFGYAWWPALAVVMALSVGVPSSPAATRAPTATEPVPSLTPVATEKLWRELVARQAARPLTAQAGCVPLRAVFYAATDWRRLATMLAENASPCAEYYVSVPPLAMNKTQPRQDEAWRIRALGPAFHAMAEISVTGWTTWVADTGSSWYQAGVEARTRMAAAGYDVTSGDTWALNELSAAVRQGTGSARANMRDFLDGLYDGDGSVPATQGAVFITGIGQGTADLSVYKSRLQSWYEDQAFWTAMSRDVSDWSQEVYGDIRRYAVPGADREARRAALNEYLQHPASLAAAAPASVGVAKTFVESHYSPLGNAAWQWTSAFGYTNVPVDLMQDYVSAQVYAARVAGNSRFGFAWQPTNLAGMPPSEFTAQTNALLARLAAAITDSSEFPDGACGVDWCNRDLDGATFTTAWQTFETWSGPGPIDTTPPDTTLLSGPSGTVASSSATFSFASNEAESRFECSLDGGSFVACDAPLTYTGLAAGLRHFEVRAIDAAGNVDTTPAEREWTVLEPPPRPDTPPSPPAAVPRAGSPSFVASGGPRVPPPGF